MLCNEHGIPVAAHNPTPADVIPLVEERLADHQRHFAKTMDPSSGYHSEWKPSTTSFAISPITSCHVRRVTFSSVAARYARAI
jgi:hypothetical protein